VKEFDKSQLSTVENAVTVFPCAGNKINLNLTVEQATKAQRGSIGTAIDFFNLDVR
jgi:hypothetical protein